MENGFNTKRLLITLSFVLLTALIVGGTTWYVMNEKNKSDRENLQIQIDELKTKDKSSSATNSQEVVMSNQTSLAEACQKIKSSATIEIEKYKGNYGICIWRESFGEGIGSAGIGSMYMRFSDNRWVLEEDTQGVSDDMKDRLIGLGFPSDWFYFSE